MHMIIHNTILFTHSCRRSCVNSRRILFGLCVCVCRDMDMKSRSVGMLCIEYTPLACSQHFIVGGCLLLSLIANCSACYFRDISKKSEHIKLIYGIITVRLFLLNTFLVIIIFIKLLIKFSQCACDTVFI